MLLLKPNCECCGKTLPPENTDARICSFECTFCAQCSETFFDCLCPNCGGELLRRPVRPAPLLAENPPSDRVFVNTGAPWYEALQRRGRI